MVCVTTSSACGAGTEPEASFSAAHWTTQSLTTQLPFFPGKVDINNSSSILTTFTLLPQFLFKNTDVEGLRNKTGFVEMFFNF